MTPDTYTDSNVSWLAELASAETSSLVNTRSMSRRILTESPILPIPRMNWVSTLAPNWGGGLNLLGGDIKNFGNMIDDNARLNRFFRLSNFHHDDTSGFGDLDGVHTKIGPQVDHRDDLAA